MWHEWKPYVPVARRRQQAKKKMQALRKKGVDIQPIEIAGRKIVTTFWGEAWCDHLESFSDFENRLPRGRTYVRNGSVCHLAIKKGQVEAKVSGSEMYAIRVKIKTLPAKKWAAVRRRCSGQIGSLLELLRGDLSDNIMQVVTDRQQGLFPLPGEISFECDCPDWAVMCKHVAAVLYGVGARLDQDPALLFRLRGVNHDDLIDVDAQVAVPTAARRGGAKRLASDDLGDVFGIDLAMGNTEETGKTDEPEVSPSSATKAKGKANKRPSAKATSLAKKGPAVKKKAPSKRSAKGEKNKVAVRRKKATKVTKKTTVRKSTKKKSSRQTAAKDRVKRAATRKAATKKKAKKTPRDSVQPVS
ncbi:MAG: hypothetical protein IID44_02015 [Planctomycetes bacterium]|nr:hypothetical protein [Planctomycetota bacterium]